MSSPQTLRAFTAADGRRNAPSCMVRWQCTHSCAPGVCVHTYVHTTRWRNAFNVANTDIDTGMLCVPSCLTHTHTYTPSTAHLLCEKQSPGAGKSDRKQKLSGPASRPRTAHSSYRSLSPSSVKMRLISRFSHSSRLRFPSGRTDSF